jgi:hypothetical protein
MNDILIVLDMNVYLMLFFVGQFDSDGQQKQIKCK